MKRSLTFVLGFCICGILVMISGSVFGDQEQAKPVMPDMTPEQQAMMAEYMKLGMPSEHHKHLDYFVGTWKTKSSMFMDGPGSQPMVSEGSSEMKWVLGGRYMMDDYKGSMMGMPYSGIGLSGYDNYRNMYTMTWCSSADTQMLTMRGTRHPQTGVFTYYGEMDEPALKVTGRTVKYVTKIIDEDHYTFEIIDLHAGDDYKVIQIDYERVK